MRKVFSLSLIFSTMLMNTFAQVITPAQSTEQCPNTNVTFTVTIAANSIQSVQPKALNVNPTVVQQPFNVTSSGANKTFNFIGKFSDYNNKQTFTVNYTNTGGQAATFDFTFPKIKSLLFANSFSQINPNTTSITAQRCQIQNFNVSFANVQYGNPFEATPIGYGLVTNYQYLLPNGWKLGTTTSNGSTWINGINSATITSDLANGDGGFVRIRPINTSCGVDLAIGQERLISITRPQPSLNINTTQSYICSTNSTTTLNLTGMPAGATVVWTSGNTNEATVSAGGTTPNATITRVGSANILVTITATVTHCSFSYVRTSQIALGTGTNSINWTQKDVVCEGRRAYFYGAVQMFPVASNYEWYSRDESVSGNPFVLQQSMNANTADFPLPGNDRQYTIRIIAYNQCGGVTSIDAEGYIYAPVCTGRENARQIQITPNPSTNNIVVQFKPSTEKLNKVQNNEINKIIITSKDGVALITKSFGVGNETPSINISMLSRDIYIIKIWDGTQWTSSKFIKE